MIYIYNKNNNSHDDDDDYDYDNSNINNNIKTTKTLQMSTIITIIIIIISLWIAHNIGGWNDLLSHRQCQEAPHDAGTYVLTFIHACDTTHTLYFHSYVCLNVMCVYLFACILVFVSVCVCVHAWRYFAYLILSCLIICFPLFLSLSYLVLLSLPFLILMIYCVI